jgi:tRNA(Ile)-lysidine synthase
VPNLLEEVRLVIREHQLLGPQQTVLVALSGGVDSMVLLHILAALAPEAGWNLKVAHVNHQLRGSSSAADERLARRTAEQMRLPLAVLRADVRALAKKRGISLEMAGRIIRHDFLAGAAKRWRSSRIALAHHQGDQLEHFFLRLLRGSGGHGLSGMKWLSPSPKDPEIMLVRPLLDCPKEAIREYAAQVDLKFREDSTNACIDIQRNRIRHELLPLLTSRYQPGLAKSLLRVMNIVGAESDLVSSEAENWLRAHSKGVGVGTHQRAMCRRQQSENGGTKQTEQSFEDLAVALQRRVIQLELMRQGIKADYDLVEHLRQHPDKPVEVSGDSVEPGSSGGPIRPVREHAKVIRLVRDGARIEKRRQLQDFQPGSRKLQMQKPGKLNWHGVNLSWHVDAIPGMARPARQSGKEFFDPDAIGPVGVIRHWRAGDRFQPIGMKSAVKLQDLFVNQKLQHEERRRRLVATTAQGELFWVEGLRISERFKLTKQTIRRLHWAWQRL